MLKANKGSALVFSLIILGFLLVSALSVATIAVADKKSALSTEKSGISFQTADSGIERVLQTIYKKAPTGLESLATKLGGGASCRSGVVSFSVAQGNVKVFFYEGVEGKTLYTRCNNDATWRSTINKIKSVGTYANTTRVVEVSINPPSPP
ncbi:MAG: pilus assembly PilX N-terminal domain-containing protein [Candidatus Moranbacteria bacterium]|nr:pilus assembly PilX N-terminal domain-containing protein [Candidatus Moranbacteria bacterium]